MTPPPTPSDLSNRPSITEKASKTFMFGGKDSLDITITLPSTAPPIICEVACACCAAHFTSCR